MLATPHVLVEGVIIAAYAIRASHAFIYVRGEVVPVLRRLQNAVAEAYAAGYLGRDILGSGFDLELMVHAGAGAYICGEETALLDSLEGRRGQPRLRPPFPAVAGLYACPTVVNNVESIASVPPIMLNGVDWFRSMGTEKSPGFTLYSLSGHVTRPGSVRGAAGHHAARTARLRRRGARRPRAEVLDARRVVDAAADRRTPRRATGLRGRGGGRLDAGHQGAADLRRDHLRGARGAAVDRVLRARVVRQVHAVPRGHLLAGPDLRAAGDRPRHRTRTSTSCWTSPTPSSESRSARWATARPARSSSSIKYFRDEYVAHVEGGGCPFDPQRLHAGARTERRDSADDECGAKTRDRRRGAPAGDGDPDHRRRRDQCSQGHVGDSRRRADGRADPAVLRPPAAGSGRRLPAVPGRGRGPAQADGVVHHRRHRRHGGAHPAHLRGRRQGPARRDGAAADQPPAGLPDLRQGRRMPAAEPGDVQRPRRIPLPDVKRTFPKPINISAQVLLDRERCVLCARCTRFSEQIAGDPFIELLERGALQQVGIYADEPFDSYFSGNTVQICPVGALTGTAYRFRARPFDLVSSPSVCEHCASGCAQRTDHRRGKVLRRLAGDDPEVNEEWNCDKGRWAFTYATQRRPDHHSAGPRRRRHAAARVVVAGDRGGGDGTRGRPRACRCAGGRPGHRRGRLRLRQVRPNGVGHQRHRLPRPPALSRGGGVPGRPRRGPAGDGQLRRPGVRAGGGAGRVRARGGVADRVPAAAQGGPQARAAGVRGGAVRHPRHCPRWAAGCS